MRELTYSEFTNVDGAAGITWDNRTCMGVSIVGGAIVGGIFFGLGGAAGGSFVGGWLGDNFCPA